MSYYNGMNRAELAADLGFVWCPSRRGYYDPNDYCRECESHTDDCECDRETTTSKTVVARKARYVGTASEVKVGDKVRVTSGFTYKPNGPRTGYLAKRYTRLAKGPAWATN